MADVVQPGTFGPWVQVTSVPSGHPVLVNMATVAWVDRGPPGAEHTARLSFIAGVTPMLHVSQGFEEIARLVGAHAVQESAGGSDAAPVQEGHGGDGDPPRFTPV